MPPHYYAGGERHSLVLASDWVAIDARAAAAAGLTHALAALPTGPKLLGGITLIETAAFPGDIRAKVDSEGVTRSAYRSGAALVVLLPEVRVELKAGQRAAVLRVLDECGIPADVTEDESAMLTLKPRSGKGEDALQLANFIYEQVRPAASSVRMLQFVPKRAGKPEA